MDPFYTQKTSIHYYFYFKIFYNTLLGGMKSNFILVKKMNNLTLGGLPRI